MDISNLKNEDFLTVCPDCKGESGQTIDGDCSTCDGTGTLLTEAGKVMAEIIRRQQIRDAKLQRRVDRDILDWILHSPS
jgi:DnaJ-class molecular chaperone